MTVVRYESLDRSAVREDSMQKKLMSTVLLFAIGVGFGIFSVVSLMHSHQTDDTIQAILYMIPAVAAFGALILLPFRSASSEDR